MRTALEALSAVLGGTQSLHTNSYDEALALPTEEAVRLALRTQQIIAHETGVTNTIDPLGGSWFVESMTNRMEEAAYDYFRKIEELGGMVEAVKRNFPQREIADASWRYQTEVDESRRYVVGVNRYEMRRRGADRDPEDRPRRSSASRSAASQATRARRDGGRSSGVSASSRRRPRMPGRNLMFPLIECARARCSEGEMIEALQEVFGSYRESPVF